ncbi:hypothetical protein C8J57DRAFT_1187577 [Mycena rebaudengoi]|nr:hypothetical protein C8J57DRAFT_1187577 [Mycena rebaudengoi]
MFPIWCISLFALESLAGALHVLNVPPIAPPSISRRLDPALTSLSVDPAFWSEFWGNSSHPNHFSMQLLTNIAERTGVYPIIRPGGVTQDSSIFDAAAGDPKRTINETSGAIFRTTWGPDFYKSFSVFPAGTRFTIPLNFGNDSLDIALDQAKAAIKYTGGWKTKIFALELGNEAGNYKATQRDLSTWGPAAYTVEWKNWTSAINAVLPPGLRTKWWAGSDGITPNPITVALQTEDLIARGLDDPPIVREFSQHMYAYSSCRPASNAVATVPNIHNHTNITAFVGLLGSKVVAAQKAKSDLVVGEFNSVSCSGKPNVTDIFGQALWVIDTTLYAASINVSRVHLHHGATLVSQSDSQVNIPGANGTPGFSTYNLWYPVDTPLRGRRRANPSYVSQLFLAETVGRSTTSRLLALDAPAGVSPDVFAAYAIYDEAKAPLTPTKRLVPKRLAIINWQILNRTASAIVAPGNTTSLMLDISSILPERGVGHPTLKRLTAPGNDETDPDLVKWAGQAWTNGTAKGKEVREVVSNGRIRIRNSEAVLVFLD